MDFEHFRDLPSNTVVRRRVPAALQFDLLDQERVMDKSFVPEPPAPTPPEDRLDSWKDIAAYLDRDVTTVQRWEKREGMPVHRHLHDKMGSVYAYRTELDVWMRSRRQSPASQESGMPGPPTLPAPSERSARRPFPLRPTFLLALAAGVVLVVGASFWLRETEFFWRSPIADAHFERVTDFDGVEQAAAVSRDGRFVAFLSDRDGRMDVWVTQVGSGQFHNLTRGGAPEVVNPSVRLLGFSPDASFVTFWVRRRDGSQGGAISIWAVSTLGGQPRLLFEGIAESDWSPDGARRVYHTPGPGDPMFVTDAVRGSEGRRIFTAPRGRHCHFPVWAPDGRFIYFVEGSLPDQLDIWRISSGGGPTERITSHNGPVSHPVLLNRRTLLYLAGDPDGSGPWLHSVDVERRIPHKLSFGVDRMTSLAASADGRRLVATIASPKRTLWRVAVSDSPAAVSNAERIPLKTATGFSPRLGHDYLLYVANSGTGSDSIWKFADGVATELWTAPGAQIFGGPAIAPDGRQVAFSVRLNRQALLYVMQADGTKARIVADGLALQGAPAWAPDGRSITSAVADRGTPHLFRVPVDGRTPSSFVEQYSIDPAWAPDGEFVVYSGPDVGTTFSVKAVTTNAVAHPLPTLTLTRGARHVTFLSGRRLVLLRGEIQHKDLWLIDLETGAERQLTNVAPDFEIRDFDISPDGREVVLERVQENSDIVLLDLPKR
jgi:Tol biopolymer transport system component